MLPPAYARAWLLEKLYRWERGQGTTEYVLVTLGVALFLVFAAMAMRPILDTAVTAIGTWIGSSGPPPAPPAP